MSTASRDITEAIRALSGMDDLGFESMAATVKSVDTTAMTCDVEPINGDADFLDVRLNADYTKGFTLIPKEGSVVILSQLSDATAYVTMVSEVDNIYLAGDANGGLVKVTDLVSKLNNLENKVNTIIATFNAHTHIASSLGAPTTPPPSPVVGTLTPTTANDLENKTIQHGNG
jgi:hypothetical protein